MMAEAEVLIATSEILEQLAITPKFQIEARPHAHAISFLVRTHFAFPSLSSPPSPPLSRQTKPRSKREGGFCLSRSFCTASDQPPRPAENGPAGLRRARRAALDCLQFHRQARQGHVSLSLQSFSPGGSRCSPRPLGLCTEKTGTAIRPGTYREHTGSCLSRRIACDMSFQGLFLD